MSDGTAIEWTDATWNVITGCSVLSPGCKRCYAMKLAGGRLQHHPSRAGLTRPSDAGPVWTGEVRFNTEWLDQPVRWKRPRDVFVCAHGDLFHEGVRDEWLHSIFDVMRRCPRHRFQVLTKRPLRAFDYIADHSVQPMHHVLIGASVENQEWADARRWSMAEISARGWRTWVSYEPALGPVNWRGWEFLRWMVCGGESGQRARSCSLEWFRSTRDWCHGIHGAPVRFFMKQMGAAPECSAERTGEWPPGVTFGNIVGGLAQVNLRDVKGGDWHEWPIALRIREQPHEAPT